MNANASTKGLERPAVYAGPGVPLRILQVRRRREHSREQAIPTLVLCLHGLDKECVFRTCTPSTPPIWTSTKWRSAWANWSPLNMDRPYVDSSTPMASFVNASRRAAGRPPPSLTPGHARSCLEGVL
jgi:hypothetical protein